jgi:hypothetical protein
MASNIQSPVAFMSRTQLAAYRKLALTRRAYESRIMRGEHVAYKEINPHLTRREDVSLGRWNSGCDFGLRAVTVFGRRVNSAHLLQTARLGLMRFEEPKKYELLILEALMASPSKKAQAL